MGGAPEDEVETGQAEEETDEEEEEPAQEAEEASNEEVSPWSLLDGDPAVSRGSLLCMALMLLATLTENLPSPNPNPSLKNRSFPETMHGVALLPCSLPFTNPSPGSCWQRSPKSCWAM